MEEKEKKRRRVKGEEIVGMSTQLRGDHRKVALSKAMNGFRVCAQVGLCAN